MEELFGLVDKAAISTQEKIFYLKELENLNSHLKNDSLFIVNSLRISNRYWNLGRKLNFKEINSNLLTYKLSGIQRGKVYLNLSDFYFVSSVMDSAYIFSKKASKIFHTEKAYKELAQSLINVGQVQHYYGEFFLAEQNAFRILKLCRSNEFDDEKYKALNLLGNVYLGIKDYGNALKYYSLAVKFYKIGDFKSPFFYSEVANFNIGLVYAHSKKYDKAQQYFKPLLTSKIKKCYPALFANALDQLAATEMMIRPRPEHAYMINLAQRMNDSLNIWDHSILNDMHLAKYYSLINNKELSNKAFKNGLEKCKTKGYPFARSIELIKEAVSTQRNRNELDVLFFRLQDSLLLTERNIRDKFARIHYETSEVLSQKEKEMKAKWFFASTSVFLLLILVLLIKIIRQRIHKNKLALEKEQYKADEKIYKMIIQHSAKLENVRVSEQQRIARELHDNVMNRLLGIRLNLFAIAAQTSNEGFRIQIDEIQNVEKEIRDLSIDLQAKNTDQQESFLSMLNNLVELYGAQKLITIDYLPNDLKWEYINSTTKINMFRIIQESINNAVKHSGCTKIEIKILSRGNAIYLSISDDGVGFEISAAEKGAGLKNMKYRAAYIGASFKIYSSSKGTKIIITVKLSYENINH